MSQPVALPQRQLLLFLLGLALLLLAAQPVHATASWQLSLRSAVGGGGGARDATGALVSVDLSSASSPASPFELTLLAGPRTPGGRDQATNVSWLAGEACTQHSAAGDAGALGVPSDSAAPAAREGAFTWTGLDGHLYLFGGLGDNFAFGDLWRFTVSTNQWVRLAGRMDGPIGVSYGSSARGTPGDTTVTPGSRSHGCAVVDPTDGSLWLYGGRLGTIALNDAFSYDIATGVWTWRAGTQAAGGTELPPNYAPGLGVAQPASATSTAGPGGRQRHTCWFGFDASASATLYIYSGFLRASNGCYGDLWSYSPATANYGTRGVSDPSNPSMPPLRYGSVGGTDRTGRTLWLHGGATQQTSGTTTYLSDLWSYSTSTNSWTWRGGSANEIRIGAGAVYSTRRVPDVLNQMPSRFGHSGTLDPEAHVMYVYGGAVPNGFMNDLWMISLNSDEDYVQTWIAGPTGRNANPNYPSSSPGWNSSSSLAAGQPAVYTSMWLGASGEVFYGMGALFVGGRCNDLLSLPSAAPVVEATLTTNLAAATTTLVSPLSAPIRLGRNMLALGAPRGRVQELTFTVTDSADSSSTVQFTLRLVQPSADTAFSATTVEFGNAGGTARSFSSAAFTSTDADSRTGALPALVLPFYTANRADGTVPFGALAAGATLLVDAGVNDPALAVSVASGGVLSFHTGAQGSTGQVLRFGVRAADGVTRANFSLPFTIATGSSDWSFVVTVSAPGVPSSFSSAALPADGLIHFPFSARGSAATLAVLPNDAGARIVDAVPAPSAQGVFSVTVPSDPSMTTAISFHVEAEGGVNHNSGLITFTITLDADPAASSTAATASSSSSTCGAGDSSTADAAGGGDDSSASSVSAGVVGGAVVGSLVGLTLLGLAVFVLGRFCRNRRSAQQAFADLQFSSGGTADVELQLDPLPPLPPQHALQRPQQQRAQPPWQQPERAQPTSSDADRTAGDEEEEPPPPPPPAAAEPGFVAGNQRAAQLQLQDEA
jgi:hypothetical protein